MRAIQQSQLITLLVAIVSIALTVLFARFRITNPSDGARFTYSVFAWKSGGIAAIPIGDFPNDLHENDIMAA